MESHLPTYRSVGIEVIDEQHEELLSRLTNLFYALKRSKDRGEITEKISYMEDFVIEHFRYEEDYMLQYNYANYLVHKYEHEKFILNLEDFKINFNKLGTATLVGIQANRLADWLLNHFAKTDKPLASFLKTKIRRLRMKDVPAETERRPDK